MLKIILFVCLYFIIGIMCWLFSLKIEYDDYGESVEKFMCLYGNTMTFYLCLSMLLWPIIMTLYIIYKCAPYIATKFLSAINKK